MTKNIYQNELRKREFLEHLKGANGFAETSINIFCEAIAEWQKYTENDDFSNFNKSKAISFIQWLNTRESKTDSKRVSLATQYNYLRRIKRFFMWLSDQPNYKSKITKSDIDFLRLSKKDARIATSGTTKKMPSFEEIRKIIENIKISNEIDKRDRAMICLALLTGIRISALTSLKMKSFNKQSKLIDQNPADGVKTKNSKRILTAFFPIRWDEPENYFIEWYEYLISKGFQLEDPIFPSTLNQFGIENGYSKEHISREPWSGTSGARKIFEKRCKDANLPYFHPHSFRHSIVNILSKIKLTEEEKKAISLNLGHANIGTTFGSYGYGSMSDEHAVEIVQKLKNHDNENNIGGISEEEKAVLERIIKRR